MRANIKKITAQLALLVLFLASSTTFIVYAKIKVTSYLAQLQSYATQISLLQNKVNTPDGIASLQSLMENISPIIKRADYLTYYLVPIILFLLWVGFIGTSFYLSKKTPKKYMHYLISFAAISIVPFILCLYLLYNLIQIGGMSFLQGSSASLAWVYGAILLLMSYFMFTAYTLSLVHPIKKTLKEIFLVPYRKAYILLPLFLLLMILLLSLVLLTVSTYFSIFFYNGSVVYNGVLLALALLLTIALKNYLIRKTIKMSNSP